MNQEVNKIVDELYSCLPNDRNKFNLIMENLKQKFLSSPNNNIRINYSPKFHTKSYTSQLINENIKANSIPNIQNNNINNPNNPNYLTNNNIEINSTFNPLKEISNFQPINLPPFNAPNKNYETLNNNENGDFININNEYQSQLFNENRYENKIQNDMHANFKYYYPEEYNSQFNDNNKNQNIDWKMNQINTNNIMYGSQNNFYKSQSGI